MPQAAPAVAAGIGAAAGVAATASTAAATAAVWSAALSVAANVALSVVVNSVVRNNSKKTPQGGLINLQLDSSAPRRLVIGKRITGGVLVDWYVAASNNSHLFLPVYLSEGPCGQITKVYSGGREVFTTPLVHGVKTVIPDFRSGGDRLWLTYYDGRVGQTADPALVALGQGWTSANTMTGCAYVVIEAHWDSDNMRTPPQLTFEMEGAKLYDRREDTTAGGSGSHRIDNPATWEFSDNPAVALDHFMLGRYLGTQRLFGIGLSSDEVPYDRFAAQANICDEDVDLKAGGTQKRYRANGFIFASDDYASTITKLCTAMAARAADFGGRFGVVGVESRTPVLTIDDADLIADAAEIYTPKRSWAQLVGAVEGRFQDPAQLYQPVDYPRVTDAAWEDEDGGEPKVATLDLEFEVDVERAQRLATLKARAERRQATLKGVYPLWTIELERGDWFERTGDRWGAGKTFEVIERILNPDTFTVSIVAQEVDAADSAWDESTAQDGPPAPIASTDTLAAVAAPALTVTSNPIVGAASNTPAIKIAFTNPDDSRIKHMFLEVYRDSDDLKVATETVGIPDDDGQVILQNGIADGVAYYVRGRYLTTTLQSDWSDIETVTTGSTYAVGAADSVEWADVQNGAGTRPTNNADVTSANTAAAIASQGAFATLSSAAYGSGLLTGFGVLASLTQVNLGASGRVYRDDGVTRLTDALAVTALGTAAAFTGQGALATLSSLAYGGAYLSGFGALAAKATIDNSALVGSGVIVYTALASTAVRLGTNITRNDGSTSLTDALAVTSLGTAAAIASQGALATLSTVGPSTLAIGDTDNFIRDVDFADSAYWDTALLTFGNTDTEITTTIGAKRGLKSATGNGTTSQGTDYAMPKAAFVAPVEPGKSYRFSLKWLAKSGFTGYAYITVYWYKQDMTAASTASVNVLGGGSDFRTVAAVGDQSGTVDGIVAAPANAVFAKAQLRFAWSTTQNNAGYAYSAIPRMHRAYALGNMITLENGTTQATNALLQTSLGTAAAITSQGALATLSTVGPSTLAIGDTTNFVRDVDFQDAAYWTISGLTFGNTDTEITTTLGAKAGLKSTTGNGTTTQANETAFNKTAFAFAVEPGKSYRVSTKWLAKSGFTGIAYPILYWYKQDLTAASTASTIMTTGAGEYRTVAAVGDQSGTVDGVVTAPANAVFALLQLRFQWSTTLANAGRAYMAIPRVTRAVSSELIVNGAVNYLSLSATAVRLGTNITRNDGSTSLTDALAVTSLGTAAAITSQSYLATASHLALNTTYIRRSDGSTSLTESLVITTLGVASSITGQGWGATASEAQARATRGRGLLLNSTFEEYFSGTATPPRWTNWTNGTGTFIAKPYGDGNCFQLDGGAAASAGVSQQTAGIQASTDYLLTAAIRRQSGSLVGAAVHVQWYTSGDVYISGQEIIFATEATTAGLVNSSPDGIQRYEKIVSAPATAAKATVFALSHWTGAGSIASANSIAWLEADLIPMALVRQLRADVTASNTASAISGQGSMATGNSYYQSSDPGGANGDFWGDTTNGVLKYKTGGSWVVIGDIGGALKVSIGAAISVIGTGGFSGTIAVTPSGGDGSYTYLWTKMPYESGVAATMTNTTTATVTVEASLGLGQDSAGRVQCVIKDGKGRSVTISQSYNFSETS